MGDKNNSNNNNCDEKEKASVADNEKSASIGPKKFIRKIKKINVSPADVINNIITNQRKSHTPTEKNATTAVAATVAAVAVKPGTALTMSSSSTTTIVKSSCENVISSPASVVASVSSTKERNVKDELKKMIKKKIALESKTNATNKSNTSQTQHAVNTDPNSNATRLPTHNKIMKISPLGLQKEFIAPSKTSHLLLNQSDDIPKASIRKNKTPSKPAKPASTSINVAADLTILENRVLSPNEKIDLSNLCLAQPNIKSISSSLQTPDDAKVESRSPKNPGLDDNIANVSRNSPVPSIPNTSDAISAKVPTTTKVAAKKIICMPNKWKNLSKSELNVLAGKIKNETKKFNTTITSKSEQQKSITLTLSATANDILKGQSNLNSPALSKPPTLHITTLKSTKNDDNPFNVKSISQSDNKTTVIKTLTVDETTIDLHPIVHSSTTSDAILPNCDMPILVTNNPKTALEFISPTTSVEIGNIISLPPQTTLAQPINIENLKLSNTELSMLMNVESNEEAANVNTSVKSESTISRDASAISQLSVQMQKDDSQQKEDEQKTSTKVLGKKTDHEKLCAPVIETNKTTKVSHVLDTSKVTEAEPLKIGNVVIRKITNKMESTESCVAKISERNIIADSNINDGQCEQIAEKFITTDKPCERVKEKLGGNVKSCELVKEKPATVVKERAQIKENPNTIERKKETKEDAIAIENEHEQIKQTSATFDKASDDVKYKPPMVDKTREERKENHDITAVVPSVINNELNATVFVNKDTKCSGKVEETNTSHKKTNIDENPSRRKRFGKDAVNLVQRRKPTARKTAEKVVTEKLTSPLVEEKSDDRPEIKKSPLQAKEQTLRTESENDLPSEDMITPTSKKQQLPMNCTEEVIPPQNKCEIKNESVIIIEYNPLSRSRDEIGAVSEATESYNVRTPNVESTLLNENMKLIERTSLPNVECTPNVECLVLNEKKEVMKETAPKSTILPNVECYVLKEKKEVMKETILPNLECTRNVKCSLFNEKIEVMKEIVPQSTILPNVECSVLNEKKAVMQETILPNVECTRTVECPVLNEKKEALDGATQQTTILPVSPMKLKTRGLKQVEITNFFVTLNKSKTTTNLQSARPKTAKVMDVSRLENDSNTAHLCDKNIMANVRTVVHYKKEEEFAGFDESYTTNDSLRDSLERLRQRTNFSAVQLPPANNEASDSDSTPVSSNAKTRKTYNRTMPLKKRWESVCMTRSEDTGISDDTTPASDDDDELLHSVLQLGKRNTSLEDDKTLTTTKKTKLSQTAESIDSPKKESTSKKENMPSNKKSSDAMENVILEQSMEIGEASENKNTHDSDIEMMRRLSDVSGDQSSTSSSILPQRRRSRKLKRILDSSDDDLNDNTEEEKESLIPSPKRKRVSFSAVVPDSNKKRSCKSKQSQDSEIETVNKGNTPTKTTIENNVSLKYDFEATENKNTRKRKRSQTDASKTVDRKELSEIEYQSECHIKDGKSSEVLSSKKKKPGRKPKKAETSENETVNKEIIPSRQSPIDTEEHGEHYSEERNETEDEGAEKFSSQKKRRVSKSTNVQTSKNEMVNMGSDPSKKSSTKIGEHHLENSTEANPCEALYESFAMSSSKLSVRVRKVKSSPAHTQNEIGNKEIFASVGRTETNIIASDGGSSVVLSVEKKKRGPKPKNPQTTQIETTYIGNTPSIKSSIENGKRTESNTTETGNESAIMLSSQKKKRGRQPKNPQITQDNSVNAESESATMLSSQNRDDKTTNPQIHQNESSNIQSTPPRKSSIESGGVKPFETNNESSIMSSQKTKRGRKPKNPQITQDNSVNTENISSRKSSIENGEYHLERSFDTKTSETEIQSATMLSSQNRNGKTTNPQIHQNESSNIQSTPLRKSSIESGEVKPSETNNESSIMSSQKKKRSRKSKNPQITQNESVNTENISSRKSSTENGEHRLERSLEVKTSEIDNESSIIMSSQKKKRCHKPKNPQFTQNESFNVECVPLRSSIEAIVLHTGVESSSESPTSTLTTTKIPLRTENDRQNVMGSISSDSVSHPKQHIGSIEVSTPPILALKPPTDQQTPKSSIKSKTSQTPEATREIFNPRLLLITNREQLNSDEPLTFSGPAAGKGPIQCGLCLKYMSDVKWKSHLVDHYGIGWIHGQPAIDIKSRKAVLQSMLAYFKAKKITIDCQICKKSFRSALGLLGHLEMCGETPARVACGYCEKEYTKTSIKAHEFICATRKSAQPSTSVAAKEPAVVEEKFTNSGRRKRASLLRAEDKLKIVSKELSEDIENDSDLKKHIKYVAAFKIDDAQREKWSEALQSADSIICPHEKCNNEVGNLSGMEEHLKICKLAPKVGYYCQSCKGSSPVIFQHEIDALQHINRKHNTSKSSKFERDSDTDCNINEADASESDDESSGSASIDEQNDSTSIQIRRKRSKHAIPASKYHKIYPQRSNDIVKSVRHKWKEFINENNAKEPLFRHAIPSIVSNSSEETNQKLMPAQNISMKFAMTATNNVKSAKDDNDIEWCELKHFEIKEITDNKEHIIFLGGPCKTLGWIPLPADVTDQYLLVTYRRDYEKYIRYKNQKSRPQLLLLYHFKSKETASGGTAFQSKLLYAFRLPDGPVHCIEFLPSGGYDTAANRLALIAVGTITSNINVYALPLNVDDKFHEFFCDESLTVPVIELKTSFVLALDLVSTSDSTQTITETQCLQICWSQTVGHRYIFAGYSNGCVGIWDVTTDDDENLNMLMVNNVQHFVPLNFFYTGKKLLRSLLVHYDTNGPRWLVTAYPSRKMLIYDIRNLTEPLLLKDDFCKNVIRCMDWPVMWETFVVGYCDLVAACARMVCAFSPHGIPTELNQIDTMLCSIAHLHYSPWMSACAAASDNGEVTICTTRELHLGDILKDKASALVGLKALNGHKLLSNKDIKKSVPNDWKRYEDDYKEKYGITFGPLLKAEPVKKSEETPPLNVQRYMRATYLRWNLNKNAKQLLAVGYDNGFVRIFQYSRNLDSA